MFTVYFLSYFQINIYRTQNNKMEMNYIIIKKGKLWIILIRNWDS